MKAALGAMGAGIAGTAEANWKNVFKKIADQKFAGIVEMEHQLSVPSRAGILKCFDIYSRNRWLVLIGRTNQ